MSVAVNPDEFLREERSRHCVSPEGRLLTWYSTAVNGGMKRKMYRFRTQRIPDADGEALRAAWGGTPD